MFLKRSLKKRFLEMLENICSDLATICLTNSFFWNHGFPNLEVKKGALDPSWSSRKAPRSIWFHLRSIWLLDPSTFHPNQSTDSWRLANRDRTDSTPRAGGERHTGVQSPKHRYNDTRPSEESEKVTFFGKRKLDKFYVFNMFLKIENRKHSINMSLNVFTNRLKPFVS